jgi:hypothetical protein
MTLYLGLYSVTLLTMPQWFWGHLSYVPYFAIELNDAADFLARMIGLTMLSLILGRLSGVTNLIWKKQSLLFNSVSLVLCIVTLVQESDDFTQWVWIMQCVIEVLVLGSNLRSIYCHEDEEVTQYNRVFS